MTGIWPTSDLYWLSAALLTIIDLSALTCLVRCVPAARFRRAGREIIPMNRNWPCTRKISEAHWLAERSFTSNTQRMSDSAIQRIAESPNR